MKSSCLPTVFSASENLALNSSWSVAWSLARAVPMPPLVALVGAAAVYAAIYAGLCLRLVGGGTGAPVVPAFQNAAR